MRLRIPFACAFTFVLSLVFGAMSTTAYAQEIDDESIPAQVACGQDAYMQGANPEAYFVTEAAEPSDIEGEAVTETSPFEVPAPQASNVEAAAFESSESEIANSETPDETVVPAVSSDSEDGALLESQNSSTLAPGAYVITPECAPGRVIDIAGASTADRAVAQLYGSNMTPAQIFQVSFEPDGSAVIANKGSGLVLGVAGSLAEGVRVVQRTPDGSAAQRWVLLDNGDGTFTVMSAAAPGLVMDISGASSADGAAVIVFGSNRTAAQRFSFVSADAPTLVSTADISDGYYVLRSRLDEGYVLGIAAGSRQAGADADLGPNEFALSQRFFVSRNADTSYRFLSVATGYALDAEWGSVLPGTRVQQYYAKDAPAQCFYAIDNGDGSISLLSKCSGLALGVVGGIARTGQKAALLPQLDGGDAVKWVLADAVGGIRIDDGCYRISSVFAVGNVLDNGNSYADEAPIMAFVFNDSFPQKFVSVRDKDGFYTFQCIASGGYLADVDGRVVLKNVSDSSMAQKWCALAGIGGIRLLNVLTGHYVTVMGDASASCSYVTAAANLNESRQSFSFDPASMVVPGWYYTLTSATGSRVLDVSGGSRQAGANIQIWSLNDSGAQKWRPVDAGNGFFALMNARSGKAVTIVGDDGRSTCGSNVAQESWRGAASQRFKLVPTGDGFFFLQSASGLFLDVANASDFDGANVHAFDGNGTRAQKFRLMNVAYQPESLSGDEELDAILEAILNSGISDLGSAFNYVAYNYSYRSGSLYPSGEWSVPFAKEMYLNGSGNCYRFASLFMWIARALGYDADVVSGTVPAVGGGRAAHGWSEVHVDGATYICDPDMANADYGHNYYMITYATAPFSYRKL